MVKSIFILITGLGLARLLIDFYLQIDISINLWELWFPGIIGGVLWWFFLRKRINVLEIPNKRDNGYFLTHIFAFLLVAFPGFVSQLWMYEAAASVEHIGHVDEIDVNNIHVRYQLHSINVDKSTIHAKQIAETSGRHNQTLNYYVYLAVQLDEPVDRETFVWIGKRYGKSLRSSSSDKEKDEAWNELFQFAQNDFRRQPLLPGGYLKRVPENGDRKNYLGAINRSTWDSEIEHIVFEMDNIEVGRAARRNAIIFLIQIGLAFFATLFVAIAFPPNKKRLADFHKGKEHLSSDEVGVRDFLLFRSELKVTAALVYINSCVLIWMIFIDINVLGPSSSSLLEIGGLRITEFQSGQYWRLISYQFIHAGIMHFLLNMGFLIIISLFLESNLSSLKYGMIYILSGLFAGVCSMYFNDAVVTVGASGALFGLVGWLGGHALRQKDLFSAFQRIKFILILAGASVAIGLILPGVDNAAHIGGFAFGILLGLIIRQDEGREIF